MRHERSVFNSCDSRYYPIWRTHFPFLLFFGLVLIGVACGFMEISLLLLNDHREEDPG
jgi:hypothetical protein